MKELISVRSYYLKYIMYWFNLIKINKMIFYVCRITINYVRKNIQCLLKHICSICSDEVYTYMKYMHAVMHTAQCTVHASSICRPKLQTIPGYLQSIADRICCVYCKYCSRRMMYCSIEPSDLQFDLHLFLQAATVIG